MKTLKRHLTVTICSAAVLFLIILVMIQSVEKNKIMGDLGQLKQRNMELQKACDELQKQIEQYENSNAELEDELIKEKRTAAAGWQTFDGVWNVSLYGADDSVTKAEAYCECVAMHHDRICVNGNEILEEPVYDIEVRKSEDVIRELETLGMNSEELRKFLHTEYCVEMNLEASQQRTEFYPDAKELVEKARYYVISEDLMICICSSDREKIYIFNSYIREFYE